MRAVLAVVAAGVLAAGCGGSPPAASPSTPTTPAVVVTAPRLHACYVLDVAAALKLSNGAAPVPCSRRHTSVTVAVGRINASSDGHQPAVDSVRVQSRIAKTCRSRVDAHVGGSREARRLSRIQAVWFSPTLTQADAGARWFRCDLVIAGSQTSFAVLPVRTGHLLDQPSSLDRYGTCGTAAPAAAGFRRVACSQHHTWRARASIDLPAGASYLAKKAGRAADSACRDIEARRAIAVTRLRWSFEWPTKAQWQGGQRYGLCWTPDTSG